MAWQAFVSAQNLGWAAQGATGRVLCERRRGSIEPPGTAHTVARGHSRVPVPVRTGFNACLVSGIRLQGETRATFVAAAGPGIPARVHYEGELRFSERVRGVCTLILDAVDHDDGASWSGYFCGHDASDLPQTSSRRAPSRDSA